MKKYQINLETNADILMILKMIKDFEVHGNHMIKNLQVGEVK